MTQSHPSATRPTHPAFVWRSREERQQAAPATEDPPAREVAEVRHYPDRAARDTAHWGCWARER